MSTVTEYNWLHYRLKFLEEEVEVEVGGDEVAVSSS